MDMHVDMVARAILRQPVQAVSLLHALYNGFLGDGLHIADRHQLGARASAGDIDLRIARQQLFPRQHFDLLKKAVKRHRLESAEVEQHAVSGA